MAWNKRVICTARTWAGGHWRACYNILCYNILYFNLHNTLYYNILGQVDVARACVEMLQGLAWVSRFHKDEATRLGLQNLVGEQGEVLLRSTIVGMRR